ncbi:hypothetical protein PBI_MINERVA_22 [Mycobacterium phage Minerva]|nr:hypothetical protein VC71_gp022 [Mycobacterium phage Minerva]AIK69231.1 hypothetical protein PBI_MINERVA_22 [Mycobacterium phage Minerva]
MVRAGSVASWSQRAVAIWVSKGAWLAAKSLVVARRGDAWKRFACTKGYPPRRAVRLRDQA